MDPQPPVKIEEPPVAEMQQLRAAFPDMDVNLASAGREFGRDALHDHGIGGAPAPPIP